MKYQHFGEGYNYNIDCDSDGINEVKGITAGNYICTYASEGNYTISVTGIFPRIYFNYEQDREKLINIEQWGNGQWESMENAFRGCINMESSATDIPDFSKVTSMKRMFLLHIYSMER